MLNLDVEFSVPFVHRLRCTADAFDPDNRTLVDLLASPSEQGPARALVFLDQGVADAHRQLVARIEQYAQTHADRVSLAGPTQVIAGGEPIKNEPRALEPMLRLIDKAHLCRRSYVVAVGGGAVLDAVGFCAAMAHRGMRHIRIASTTLAQADSAMGVKNGINAFGKKNYLGAFTPPWAVINDESLLPTLSDVDWVSGFSEAVKVALLKDAALFEQIESAATRIAARDMEAAMPIVRRSAELHFDHITRNGDPFELTAARPLDFGHWAAHRLEHLTEYQLPHGHAVAIGMALDLTYAARQGWLSQSEQQRIVQCLSNLGFDLYHPAMARADDLLMGLDEFREHLGGALTVPMIGKIGSTFDVHDIDHRVMRQAIEQLASARPTDHDTKRR